MPYLTEKRTSPSLAIDRLELPSRHPTMPESFVRKFPELSEFNENLERFWRKSTAVLSDFADTVADPINGGGGVGGDPYNLRVSIDGLTAEVQDLANAMVSADQALAQRIITVSALASSSSGITVASSPPSLPVLNDIWVDNSVPTQPITRQWSGLAWVEVTEPITAAAVAAEQQARITADGFLEGKYTLTVVAGDVVTGMNITSASGPGTTVSDVTFQADRFRIYNGTAGMVMFDVSSTQVRLGGTLVVDTPNNSVYIGTGSYANPNTAWFVDGDGRMSLKDKFIWDGDELTIDGSIAATTGFIGGFEVGSDYIRDTSNLMGMASTVSVANDVRFWAGSSFATRASAPFRVYENGLIVATNAGITGTILSGDGQIGGWTINATTIDKNNTLLDSAGRIVLGTGNDTVYLSSIDATYRIWIGNATASLAPFRVSKAGAVTATSGTVGGWTLGSTTFTGTSTTLDSAGTLVLGTSDDVVVISAVDSTYRIWIGDATAGDAAFRVTKDGLLTATNAVITGTILSSSIVGGSIDIGTGLNRFLVDATAFYYGDTSGPHIYMDSPFAGGLHLVMINGASFPTITMVISASTASLSLRSAANASITVGDTALTEYVLIEKDEINISGNKVLGPRITGWTAGTGTANRAGFTASTPAEQALKALIDDLITMGQIGA